MKVGADTWILLVLAACGSGSDQPLTAEVPAPVAPTSLLEQAALQARTPRERTAVARAYVARGSLAQATAALGRAQPETLAENIAFGEVRGLLGQPEDFAAMVMPYASAMEPPRGGFAAALKLAESPPAIEAVAEGMVIERDYADDLEIAELGGVLVGAKLDAVIAAARALGEPNRSEHLLFLARVARHQKLPIAHVLALASGSTKLALVELANQGELAAARKLHLPKEREMSAGDRFAEQAEINALLSGAGPRSRMQDMLPYVTASKAPPEPTSERGWKSLALAGYPASGFGTGLLITEHPSADLAWALADRDHLTDALHVAQALKGDVAETALADVVWAWLVRGEREKAAEVSLSMTTANGDHPGFDDVLRATARAGDLPRLAALFRDYRAPLASISRDAATSLAAESLAARGECPRAAELARTVKIAPAETYAIVARYCPNT